MCLSLNDHRCQKVPAPAGPNPLVHLGSFFSQRAESHTFSRSNFTVFLIQALSLEFRNKNYQRPKQIYFPQKYFFNSTNHPYLYHLFIFLVLLRQYISFLYRLKDRFLVIFLVVFLKFCRYKFTYKLLKSNLVEISVSITLPSMW